MAKVLDKNTGLMTENKNPEIKFNISKEGALPSSTAYDPSGVPLKASDWSMIDKSIIPVGGYEALRTERKDSQSTLGAVANGAMSAILSVGTKLGQAGSALGGLAYWGVRAGLDEDYSLNAQTFADVYDNAAMNWFANAEESIKEAFPIYYDQQYESDRFLDRLGTAKFWAGDAFDGLSYLASSYLTGGLGNIAGRGLAGSISKGLTTRGVAGFATTANSIGARAAALNNVLGVGTATVLNTVSEAAVEAHDIKKQVYDLALEVYGDEETALRLSTNAAANTFNLNSLLLIAPNILQSKLFFKTFKNSDNVLRDVANGVISPGKYKMGKDIMMNTFKSMASEGLWEEGMQNAIQNLEKKKAFGMYEDTISDTIRGLGEQYFRGFSTQEGQNSMFIGAVIGALGGGVGSYRTAKAKMKQYKDAADIVSKLKNLESIADGNFIDSMKAKYKTKDGKFEFSDKGELIINENWVQERAKDLLNDIDYETEKTLARLNNDTVREGIVDGFYYSRKLYNYLTSPMYEDSNEAYDTMIKGLEGDLNTLFDIESDEGKTKVKEFKEKIVPVLQQLKQVYDNITKSYKTEYTKDPEYDGVVNNKLKQMLFYVASKNAILSNSLQDPNLSETAKEEIQGMISEGQDMITTLSKRGKERTKFVNDFLALENKKKTYKERINKINSELNKTEKDKDGKEVPVAIAPERRKELEQEERKLNYELSKEFYINGVSELERLAPELASVDPDENKRLNFSTQRGSRLKVLEKSGEITKFRIETDKELEEISTAFEELNTKLKEITDELYAEKATYAGLLEESPTDPNLTSEQIEEQNTERAEMLRSTIESIKELNAQYNEVLQQFAETVQRAITVIHVFDDRMRKDPENFSEEDLEKFKTLESIIYNGLGTKIQNIQTKHKSVFDDLFILSQNLTLEQFRDLKIELNSNTNPDILQQYNTFINDYNNVEQKLNDAVRAGILINHIFNDNLDVFLESINDEYFSSLPAETQAQINLYRTLEDSNPVKSQYRSLIISYFTATTLLDPDAYAAFTAQWESSEQSEEGEIYTYYGYGSLLDYLTPFLANVDNIEFLLIDLGEKFPDFANPSIKVTDLLTREAMAEILAQTETIIHLQEFDKFINGLPENTVEEYINKKNVKVNSDLINFNIFFNEYLDTSKQLEHFKEAIGRKFEELQQIAKPNSKIQQWSDLNIEEKEEYLEKDFINNIYSYGYIQSFYKNFKKAHDANDTLRLEAYDNLTDLDNAISSLYSIIDGIKEESFEHSMKDVLQEATEMVDYLNNIVRPIIEKNQQNRALAQQKSVAWNNITKWKHLGIKINININTGLYDYELDEVGARIKTYLGEETFIKLLKEGVDNKFDAVVYEKMISSLKTLPKETLDKLKQEIKDKIEEVKNDSENWIRKDSIGLDKKATKISMPHQVATYLSNPDYFYELFTENMLPQGYVKTKEFYISPIFNYTQHRSLAELHFELQSYNNDIGLDLKDFRDALEYHVKYSSLLELESELENDNTYLEYNKKLKELVAKENITLNRQQEISLYELYKWYKRDEQQYSFLQGIAGTGKTTVVMNYFIKLMGIPTDKIIGTAHNESAVNTLYDVINPTTAKENKHTLAQLLSDVTKLQSLDLLVIDEILANNNEDVNLLISTIKAEQKRRKDNSLKPLKIFLMGDPNQITNVKNFTVLGMWSLQGILPSLKIVPPLTVAYRSDVGAINTFSNTFQNKTFKIEGLQAIHSEEFTKNDALGVYVMKNNETKRDGKGLLEDIKLRIKGNKDNGRNKKVVIVSNPQDLAAYSEYVAEAQNDNVVVMHYTDVQGMTFDEVYIDIKEKDIPIDVTKAAQNEYDRHHQVNTVYYTALSRSKSFTMFFDETGTMFNKEDKSVIENNSAAIKEKVDLKTEMTTLIDFRLKALGVIPTATEEESEEESEATTTAEDVNVVPDYPIEPNEADKGIDPDEQNVDESEESFEEEERYTPVEDFTEPEESEESRDNNPPRGGIVLPIDPESNVVHNVNAPTTELIKPDKNNNNAVKAEVGTDVVYMLVKKVNKATMEEDKAVAVYSRRTENGQINTSDNWDLLTITLAKNLNPAIEFERKLLEKLNNTSMVDFKTFNDNKSLLHSEVNGNKFVFLQGKINFVQNLSFEYKKKAEGATHVGSGLTNTLRNKMLPFVTLNDGTTASVQYGNISNIEYKIYSKKEINSLKQKDQSFPLQTIDAGKPFAVFTFETGDRYKSLYIRQDPAKMSKDHKLLQPILSVNSSVNFISSELGKLGLINELGTSSALGDNLFNELSTLFRKNFESKDGVIQRAAIPHITKEKNREEVIAVLNNPKNSKEIPAEKFAEIDNLTDSIIDIFNNEEVDGLYKGVYTSNERIKRTSILGYADLIRDNLDNLDKDAADAFLKMIDSYYNVSNSDYSDIEFGGAPFKKYELSLLMSKKNGINLTDLFGYYAKAGLDVNMLPAARNTGGYDYNKYKNNGGYTHFRIKQLRFHIAKQSYIKITKGENAGKYYAFDPLTGKIRITSAAHSKGYVSSRALKEEGIEYTNYKETGLTKSGSPLEVALKIISRNNKFTKPGGSLLRIEYTTKDNEKKYSAPSILSYDSSSENSYSTGIFTHLRQLWREHITALKDSPQGISAEQAARLLTATYSHHESGLDAPLLYLPNDNLKNRDTKYIFGLRKDVDLQSEEVLEALLSLMNDFGVTNENGEQLNKEYLDKLQSNPEFNKPKATLTASDLNHLSEMEGDRSSNIRTPLDSLYLANLNKKANPVKETNRTPEENKALEELEGMLETHFEKLHRSKVQIKTDWKSDSTPAPSQNDQVTEQSETENETAENLELNDVAVVEETPNEIITTEPSANIEVSDLTPLNDILDQLSSIYNLSREELNNQLNIEVQAIAEQIENTPLDTFIKSFDGDISLEIYDIDSVLLSNLVENRKNNLSDNDPSKKEHTLRNNCPVGDKKT